MNFSISLPTQVQKLAYQDITERIAAIQGEVQGEICPCQ